MLLCIATASLSSYMLICCFGYVFDNLCVSIKIYCQIRHYYRRSPSWLSVWKFQKRNCFSVFVVSLKSKLKFYWLNLVFLFSICLIDFFFFSILFRFPSLFISRLPFHLECQILVFLVNEAKDQGAKVLLFLYGKFTNRSLTTTVF